jgi:hypothetical protein
MRTWTPALRGHRSISAKETNFSARRRKSGKSHFIRYFGIASILILQLEFISAQEWCDSSFEQCDSITIVSVLFTHVPTTGDRVHFYATNYHEFLHGPAFIICTDDNLDFVSDIHLYTGLPGPFVFTMFYEFVDFSMTGDTLTGHLVVDNRGNAFPNCIIPYQFPIPDDILGVSDISVDSTIEVYPNPADDRVFININAHNVTVHQVQLTDLLGRRLDVHFTSSFIDVSELPPGCYGVRNDLVDGRPVVRKINID